MNKREGTTSFFLRVQEKDIRSPSVAESMTQLSDALRNRGLAVRFQDVARGLQELVSQREEHKKALGLIGEDAEARKRHARSFVNTETYQDYANLVATREGIQKGRDTDIVELNAGIGSFVGRHYLELKKMRNELSHAPGGDAAVQRNFLDAVLAKPFESARLAVEDKQMAGQIFGWIASTKSGTSFRPISELTAPMQQAFLRGGEGAVAEWMTAKAQGVSKAENSMESLSHEMRMIGRSIVDSPFGQIEFGEALKQMRSLSETERYVADQVADANDKAAENRRLIDVRKKELDAVKAELDAVARGALNDGAGAVSVDRATFYPFVGELGRPTLDHHAWRWFIFTSYTYTTSGSELPLEMTPTNITKNALKVSKVVNPNLHVIVQMNHGKENENLVYVYGEAEMFDPSSRVTRMVDRISAGRARHPYYSVVGDTVSMQIQKIGTDSALATSLAEKFGAHVTSL